MVAERPLRRPPRLLAISDRRQLPGGNLGPWAAALAASGVDAVQIRERDLPDLAVLELVGELRRRLSPEFGVLVNSRPDLALAAGADGVHLPAAGLATAEVKRRFGGELLIGRSTHTLAEVERARDEGADYVLFGPIFPSPGKAGFGPPLGLDALTAAARLGVPVLAVGGVTIHRLPAIAAAGAFGAAGIREFLREEGLPRLAAAAEVWHERR